MLTFKEGEILNSEADALVNTVNTEGVMGKGIALEFKESFPENFKLYKEACEKGEVRIGKMFVTKPQQITNPKYIINFPTKKHWRYPSKIEYIQKGLKDLKNVISKYHIESIAIPPLGCGSGKLNWHEVKPLITRTVEQIPDLEAIVFEPSDRAYEEIVKSKPVKKMGLTPARALVLNLLKQYLILGYDLTLLEAQKLAYFLQRFGENLKLRYDINQYGPYAKNLDYLLNSLEGHYIRGMKHKDIKPFDAITLIPEKFDEVDEYIENECTDIQRTHLKKVYELIEGFESPLGMELLGTVDYILRKYPDTTENGHSIMKRIHNWSSENRWNTRKKRLLKPSYVEHAYERLMTFRDSLYKD